MKTTVEIGRELEDYVVSKFKDLGFKYVRRSNGSGNKGELGDISGQDLAIVECKQVSKDNITIKESVWKKLLGEIPLHSQRFPIYILGNKQKRRWAVVDVEDLFMLLESHLAIKEIDNGE